MPGTQEEMTRFQEDTVSSSKVHVECTFPRLDANLHTKDVFENIYNRLVRLSKGNESFIKYIEFQSLEKKKNDSLVDLKAHLWLDQSVKEMQLYTVMLTWYSRLCVCLYFF